MSDFPYSTLLHSGVHAGPGAAALYTVPSGKIAVVRDVCVLSQTAAGQCLLLDGGAGVNFWSFLFTAALQAQQWTGRQVFPAGAVLELNILAAATFQVRASGYLLTA